MPTEVEVARAARRLRRSGERVSVRNVRRLLPRGGSYGTIGPLLARWKADAGYRPGKLPEEVPPALNEAVNAFAVQVWAAARAEAAKVVEVERRRLELLEREHEREAIAAWAEVDRLEEASRELGARLARAERQLRPARRPAPPTEPEEIAERERLRGFVEALPGDLLGTKGREPSSAEPGRGRTWLDEADELLRPLEEGWTAGRDGSGARRGGRRKGRGRPKS